MNTSNQNNQPHNLAPVTTTQRGVRTELEYGYKSKPSWKVYGEGRVYVRFSTESDESVHVIASEGPVGGRGRKEVYFLIPKHALAAINAAFQPKVPSLDWVENLYEVGAPIRDAASDLKHRVTVAQEALVRAQKQLEAELASATLDAIRVEKNIAALWTPAEIAAAKEGSCLADGQKFKINE